jgi:hypothetical protein
MFDLTKNDLSVAAEAGYEFELMLPTGEATGAFITVRGEQSPAVKAYGRKMFNLYQQKQKIAKRRGKEDDLDLDEAEDMSVEAAYVRIIGWREIAESGKAVEFNADNAKRILKAHSWIREAVMEESTNLHNFRK